MSLFSEIVNSIGSDQPPTPPKPPARPLSANSQRPASDVSKPGLRPSFPSAPSPLNGTKRKAEDGSAKRLEKIIKPNPTPGLTSSINRRSAAPPLNAPKPLSNEKTSHVRRPNLEPVSNTPKSGSTPPVTPTTTAGKLPVKGSYADIMARAKQAQEARAQSQVGMIKHQATNREKISKVAERRRQEEEKAKSAKEKSGGRMAPGKGDKSRSVSPAKKTDQPKVPKAPRPPLHAPKPAYKGTMGRAASRSKQSQLHKRRRYDEYLGTDEEDESDNAGSVEDDAEDYGSDASSDMEATAFEMDAEEQKALRAAKQEDAEELALEARLKREKEERRRKLQGLASKRK